MSHNAEAICGGGFQVASPVKKPRASEMLRSAPPYTNWTPEEPCQGAADATGLLLPVGNEAGLGWDCWGRSLGLSAAFPTGQCQCYRTPRKIA